MALLGTASLFAAPREPSSPATPAKPAWPTRSVTSADCVVWAGQDAERLTSVPGLITDLRYVRWVQVRDLEEYQELTLALNYVSNASIPLFPPLGVGNLVRVDLTLYAYDRRTLDEWVELWEGFQYDPAFSRLITGDTLRFLDDEARRELKGKPGLFKTRTRKVKKTEDVLESCPVYKHTDGKYYNQKWVKKEVEVEEEVKDVVLVREDSRVLDSFLLEKLRHATYSQAPLVSARYIIPRLQSTIKYLDANDKVIRDQLFAQLYGGVYYEFAGIRKSKDKDVTDLDLFLFDLGIGTGKKRFEYKEIFDRLRSDQRAAIFQSQVTGKPRVVLWVPTLAVRPGEASGVGFFTLDLRNKDIDIGVHPMFNLLKFSSGQGPQAYEVIVLNRFGLCRFAIFGADGQLLEVAGQDVVGDRTVPSPYTPELQGPMGCIRCHGPFTGFQPFANDVEIAKRTILHEPQADIIADFGDRRLDQYQALDRLRGLYAGRPDKALIRAKDDYSAAMLLSSGPWRGQNAQAGIVNHASAKLAALYHEMRYRQIDAAYALADLGFQVPGDKTLEWFRLLTPADKLADTGKGFVLEDVRIAALRDGRKINRVDFDLVRDFLAERMERQWAELEASRNEQPATNK